MRNTLKPRHGDRKSRRLGAKVPVAQLEIGRNEVGNGEEAGQTWEKMLQSNTGPRNGRGPMRNSMNNQEEYEPELGSFFSDLRQRLEIVADCEARIARFGYSQGRSSGLGVRTCGISGV